ncbi:Putative E3 ubiquitin-protein ligase UBR7 [Myotis brandtii]|uniref:Putative E3 ubiquitin-protein ligase UBR7 n=1 Tax=Myotis brandtii TaxID=109478 RepID=S7NCV4_MYOBR|nr:Putative E3 ubiquitin-protein ligase UBR7 [Myotis brandtii]
MKGVLVQARGVELGEEESRWGLYVVGLRSQCRLSPRPAEAPLPGGLDGTHTCYPQDKAKINSGNKYNDNFFGLYCICKRPYPDPDDEIPDEMIQCVVCEDWFHGRHLGAMPPESGDFQEMVCQACMKRCSFLWAYAAQLAVTKVSAEDDGLALNVDGIGDEEVTKPENGDHHDSPLKEDVPEHAKDAVKAVKAEQTNEPCASSSSESDLQTVFKNQHLNTESQTGCKLQELKAKHFIKKDTATFWPLNWRSKLCTCKDCMKMYGDLDVLFLTDEYDTVLAYENKGKVDQAAGRTDPLMDTLSSMNRVQQVELICEYNDLKTELKDYLKRFADEGTVVKREDIQQFFEEFQSKKRRRVDGMQYYCS